MGYQKPTYPDAAWDGTSPSYESRQIDTLPDSSMTDRFTSEIIAIQNQLYGIKDVIGFFETIGSANSVVAVDVTGSEFKYKTLIGGGSTTVTSTDSAILISSTGNGGGVTPYSAEAGENVITGQPIYLSGGKLYGADSGNSSFIGIMMEDANTGISGNYSTDGKVEQVDWTAIIGSATLSQGSIYFVNGTGLSTTPPSTGYILQAGRAVTTTILDVEIQQHIKL